LVDMLGSWIGKEGCCVGESSENAHGQRNVRIECLQNGQQQQQSAGERE
jgi:hypothetical protein